MKIQKLLIRNFRAVGNCPDDDTAFPVELDLEEDLIVLIGRNNSGKSSVLEAYNFFYVSAQKPELEDFFNRDQTNEICIEAVLLGDEQDLSDEQTGKWFDPATGIARVRKTWTTVGTAAVKDSYDHQAGNWVVGGFGGWDTILQNRAPEPVLIKADMTSEELVALLQSLIKAIVLAAISETDAYKTALEALEKIREEVEGHEYIGQIETRLSDSIQDVFPDVGFQIVNPISDKQITTVFDKQVGIKVVEDGKEDIPLERQGHGLRRQFVLGALRSLSDQLAAAAAGGRKDKKKFEIGNEESNAKILLFEEPELHLHPQAILIVRDLIKKLAVQDDFQVLTTTHSPLMIDVAGNQQSLARVVSDPVSGCRVHQFSHSLFDDDDKRKLQMLRFFDLSACQAFFATHVVVTEGDSESVALAVLIERGMEEIKEIVRPQLHILNARGKRTIPVLQKILRHFHIEYHVLHDADRRLSAAGDILPVWRENETIWRELMTANSEGTATLRMVAAPDFESVQGYELGGRKKAKAAADEALTWDLATSDLPIVRYFRHIVGLESMVTFDGATATVQGLSTMEDLEDWAKNNPEESVEV